MSDTPLAMRIVLVAYDCALECHQAKQFAQNDLEHRVYEILEGYRV
jgi:hypothetical protein